jgi:hypothetical protein
MGPIGNNMRLFGNCTSAWTTGPMSLNQSLFFCKMVAGDQNTWVKYNPGFARIRPFHQLERSSCKMSTLVDLLGLGAKTNESRGSNGKGDYVNDTTDANDRPEIDSLDRYCGIGPEERWGSFKIIGGLLKKYVVYPFKTLSVALWGEGDLVSGIFYQDISFPFKLLYTAVEGVKLGYYVAEPFYTDVTYVYECVYVIASLVATPITDPRFGSGCPRSEKGEL